MLGMQKCLPAFALYTLTHVLTLTHGTLMFIHSHLCPYLHTHVHSQLHTHTHIYTLTCILVLTLIHTHAHIGVCWNGLELPHESLLLHFQEFCGPVIKHCHYKLNYINLELNKLYYKQN